MGDEHKHSAKGHSPHVHPIKGTCSQPRRPRRMEGPASLRRSCNRACTTGSPSAVEGPAAETSGLQTAPRWSGARCRAVRVAGQRPVRSAHQHANAAWPHRRKQRHMSFGRLAHRCCSQSTCHQLTGFGKKQSLYAYTYASQRL